MEFVFQHDAIKTFQENEEAFAFMKTFPWPRISVVTPSYNHAQFLETAILSVLNQNYPNLEYIIIDGGSTDGSVEIIKRYEKHLTYWVSEGDKGPADASNKGFVRSSGDILGWIPADDKYEPGVFFYIAKYFLENPDVSLLYGDVNLIDANDNITDQLKPVPETVRSLIYGCNLHIGSAFWKREVFFGCGMFSLIDATEYEFLFKVFATKQTKYVRKPIANLRIHPQTRSVMFFDKHRKEATEIIRSYVPNYPSNIRLWRIIYKLRRCLLYVVQGDLEYMFIRFYKLLGK